MTASGILPPRLLFGGAPQRRLVLDETPHLVLRQLERFEPVERGLHNLLSFLHQARARNHRIANEGARAMPEFNDSLMLELAIRAGDSVGIDHEIFRHLAHAWKLIAGLDRAGLDCVLDLLDQLKIKRDA